MKATDKAYAAGILDGEGSVLLTRMSRGAKGQPWWKVVVSVANCDVGLIYWLNKRWPGVLLLNRKGGTARSRPQHLWRLYGSKAETFLVDVEPYIVLKQDRVSWALQFRAAQGRRAPGKPHSQSERKVLEALLGKFKQSTLDRRAAQNGRIVT